MIRIVLSKLHMSSPIPFALISLFSIHAKLRDATLGYNITSSFFLHCLYQGKDGDPKNPLEGFLKGPLLVHVSHHFITMLIRLLILLWQAFWHIFKSPFSTAKNETSEVTSRWHNIANVLRMNHHITPQSIGYAATQVHWHILIFFSSFLMFTLPPPKLIFSLSTAREWKHKHNGFYYPSFYDFIVDFFEDAEDNTVQKNADDVLDWWNWYVLSEIWNNWNPNISVVLAKCSPIFLAGVVKTMPGMWCNHRWRGSRMLARGLFVCRLSKIHPKYQIICFFFLTW